MNPVAQICDYLTNVKPGKISDAQLNEVEGLLSSCWESLEGWSGGGVVADKLIGRTEEMGWRPPTLSFKIERHGGLVNGSSRAEVQQWRVDLEHQVADFMEVGRRQNFPMASRLDVRPIAAKIAALISNGCEDKPPQVA